MARKVDERAKEEMRKMFHEGKTYKEIAERLGFSYKTVAFHLRKMGLKRKTTDEKKDMIRKLYEKGYKVDEIARMVGLSRSKVFYHLKKMNVKRRHEHRE